MTEADSRFAERAVRRRPLFLALSWIGVAVAVALGGYYAYRRYEDPAFPLGVRIALVTLILLNARQNLRQYKYAGILGTVTFNLEKDSALGGERRNSPRG
jgi:hypothetical protein